MEYLYRYELQRLVDKSCDIASSAGPDRAAAIDLENVLALLSSRRNSAAPEISSGAAQ
jgi:hypothetical protein